MVANFSLPLDFLELNIFRQQKRHLTKITKMYCTIYEGIVNSKYIVYDDIPLVGATKPSIDDPGVLLLKAPSGGGGEKVAVVTEGAARYRVEKWEKINVLGSKLPLFPYNRGWSSTQ